MQQHMNRYFFCQKNDNEYNKIGQTFATSRYLAAVLFSFRKGINLKEFLKIYSVYSYPSFNINTIIKIKHFNDETNYSNSMHYALDKNNKFFEAYPKGRLQRDCFKILKPKYSVNKFIQMMTYLQKEDEFKIIFDSI
jgi:hypothetical protein